MTLSILSFKHFTVKRDKGREARINAPLDIIASNEESNTRINGILRIYAFFFHQRPFEGFFMSIQTVNQLNVSRSNTKLR